MCLGDGLLPHTPQISTFCLEVLHKALGLWIDPILLFLHPKRRRLVDPAQLQNLFCANRSWYHVYNLYISILSEQWKASRKTIIEQHQTCKKPGKGARPVPEPVMTIATERSAGSLRFDCLIKIGAQLSSNQWGFWKFIVMVEHSRINGLYLRDYFELSGLNFTLRHDLR